MSSVLPYTSIGGIAPVVAAARAHFKSGSTLDVSYRRHQLRQLALLLQENIEEFIQALALDLNKPRQESITAEIDNTIADALKAEAALGSWTAPQRPSVDAVNIMDGCQIQAQPYGTCLIIGAWNYPVLLIFKPLVGAIAAGNTAVLKPSEVSAHTAALVTRLLPRYLDPKAFHIVNGGVNETTELLSQPFDFIMYTGNGQVGRVVAAAAAKNLTPICLELGGKSPVVVDENVDVALSARRIMWGRCLNAGQTCIAADYVLCHRNVADAFASACAAALTEFFGSDNAGALDNLSRIVAERHYDRLADMLKRTKGKVVAGGLDKCNRKTLMFAPTVLSGVKPGDALLAEEIFGPILPIMAVDSVGDAIEYINSHDKPLALYVFSKSSAVVNQVLSRTTSGGAVANDCLMQVSVSSLPFGGVGPSGSGAYHGKASFDLFSHKRSVMIKTQAPLLNMESLNAMRYPPYSDTKLRWLQRLVFAHRRPKFLAPFGALMVAAVAVAIVAYPDVARSILKRLGFGAV